MKIPPEGPMAFCHRKHLDLVKLLEPSGDWYYQGEFCGTCGSGPSRARLRSRGLDRITLMDRFFLLYDPGDDLRLGELQESFFDLISVEYDSIIDVENNRRMAARLLALAAVNLWPPGSRLATVLDFGSGTGLSSQVFTSGGCLVTGCDASPRMRAAAEAAGIVVVPPEGLGAMAGRHDALLASYVLHLAVPDRDLRMAALSVRVGGVMVANFHKGLRVHNIRTQVARWRDFAEVGALPSLENHYVAVWRRIE